MSQSVSKIVVFVLMMLGLLTLAACSTGQATPAANSVTPDRPSGAPADSVKLSTPAGPANPAAPDIRANPGDWAALAYNPADGGLLKADSQGLSRWQAGSDWEKVSLPQEAALSGVAINPDQPAIIYVSGFELGVIRSDDSGGNWQAVNAGLPSLDVTALAMHSFRRDTLYAWINNGGIYRSEDGGTTWKKIPDIPMTEANVYGLVHSTLPGSMNTGWLYAATPGGAYLSMD
jgi:hypothetical protein